MLEFFNRLLNNEKGFTLIEVLVVVAIIGILIAFAAPRVLTRLEDARVASDESVAKVLNDAIVLLSWIMLSILGVRHGPRVISPGMS